MTTKTLNDDLLLQCALRTPQAIPEFFDELLKMLGEHGITGIDALWKSFTVGIELGKGYPAKR